jgi:hypothetical protein
MCILALTLSLAAPGAGPGTLSAVPTTQPAHEPTTRPGKGFTIAGVLLPPERVKQVRLIDRDDPANALTKQARVFAATFDRRTGRFTAENLPRGFYDLMIETDAGPIDGVNLRDTPDPFDLAPPTGEKPPLDDEDRRWIQNYVDSMKTFENRKRLVAIGGNGERAKALVELIRDQPTTLDRDAIWRVEVWEFRKQYGAWRRVKWAALYRRKMPVAELRALKWLFDPALGGLPAQAGCTTDLGEYRIPEKLDPAMGRSPGGDSLKPVAPTGR